MLSTKHVMSNIQYTNIQYFACFLWVRTLRNTERTQPTKTRFCWGVGRWLAPTTSGAGDPRGNAEDQQGRASSVLNHTKLRCLVQSYTECVCFVLTHSHAVAVALFGQCLHCLLTKVNSLTVFTHRSEQEVTKTALENSNSSQSFVSVHRRYSNLPESWLGSCLNCCWREHFGTVLG